MPVIDAPFGRVTLTVECDAPRIAYGPTPVPVDLLPQNDPTCSAVVVLVHFLLRAGQRFGVRVVCEPAEGWNGGGASGQYFNGYELDHPSGRKGAYGTRDDDWFQELYPLRFRGGADLMNFEAVATVPVVVEAAAAWTNNPVSNDDASAWCTVDHALR